MLLAWPLPAQKKREYGFIYRVHKQKPDLPSQPSLPCRENTVQFNSLLHSLTLQLCRAGPFTYKFLGSPTLGACTTEEGMPEMSTTLQKGSQWPMNSLRPQARRKG